MVFFYRTPVFTIAFLCILLSASLPSRAQILLDDFERPDNSTVGNGWNEVSTSLFSNNSRITAGSLQIIASSATANADLSYRQVDTYNPVLSANTGILTWACNMRQTVSDPGGFNSSSSNGIAFILGFQSSFLFDIPIAPSGYAVVLGQPGTIDPIRLVHFDDIGNSDLTNIISSGDYGNEYLSIRVTYDPVGNLWSLFVESSSTGYPRADPRLTATQVGPTVSDNTYTNDNLAYVGLDWHHSVSSPDHATFDDVYVPNNYIINHFRSKQSGDWNVASTWEMSSDNAAWVNATLTPTAESNTIAIRTTHTVTLSSSTTTDQTTVQSGGTLSLTGGSLSLSDGAVDDLIIASGGIFQHGNSNNTAVSTPIGMGTIRISNGGTIRVINATGGQADQYANNEDLALANRVIWENNSIFDWNGLGFSTAGITYFPNVNAATVPVFRISQNQGNAGAATPTVINGLLEANANIGWQGTGAKTFRNGISGTGNVVQNAGSGPFDITGPQAQLSGAGEISLSASGMRIFASTLDCPSSKTVSGSVASIITLVGGASQQLGGVGTLSFGANTTLNVQNNVSLAGNIVANNLSFTAGKLVLNTSNLTVNGTITGASTTSYIVSRDDKAGGGFLSRNVGATLVSFPIGTASSYTPVSISNSTGTLPFQVRVFNDIFTNGTAGNVVNNLNDAVRKTWEIIPTGSANANLVFTWNPSDEGSNFAASTSMRSSVGVFKNPVAAAPNNIWTILADATTAATGSNPYSLTVLGITTFSTFALASPFVALPVTLLSFTGKRRSGLVQLEWITSAEKDNAGFEIQRSENAKDFSPIGFVKSSTTPASTRQYSFRDESDYNGQYYRLRQVDIDGRYEYSKIIFVPSHGVVSLSPNPTRGLVKLTLPSGEETQLTVVNAQGVSLSSYAGSLSQVNQQLNEELNTWPSGLYFLQIDQGGNHYFFRLMKE